MVPNTRFAIVTELLIGVVKQQINHFFKTHW